MTSLVERLDPIRFVLFRHNADTKESGKQEREKEWPGGMESYSLVEEDGVTVLTIKIDTPPGQEATLKNRLPEALTHVKILKEK